MQINTPDVKQLCGTVSEKNDIYTLRPFDDNICAFLAAVSEALMRKQEARAYSDVITFAFFCRKGNIDRLKKEYDKRTDGRLGRGLTFHIAPSNVPVNFAYSLVAALLAGNAAIVKASSKDFVQTRIIAEAMKDVLEREEFQKLRPYVTILTYPRERQDITELISALCNVRIIWGGDRTIETVRRSSLPPRSFDITFADRYSFAVFDIARVRDASDEDMWKLAVDFYNDTYLYDQNACTSPRLIYWVGEVRDAEKARRRFWDAVYEKIRSGYEIHPGVAVDKRDAECRAAIELNCAVDNVDGKYDNRIVLVRLLSLSKKVLNIRAAGGYFYEYVSSDLNELKEVVDEKYQAVGVYGIRSETIVDFVVANGLHGIDRVRPIGHLTDFDLTWDGYDLIETLSRRVVW